MQHVSLLLRELICLVHRAHAAFQVSKYAYLASALLMLMQRSPITKVLVSLRYDLPSKIAQIARLGVPIGVVSGTHAVTGATSVAPLGGFTNPAEAKVGEPFSWGFRTLKESSKSYTVAGLPGGLVYDHANNRRGISYFDGVPTESGEFVVEITGWRGKAENGAKTPTYELVLKVLPSDKIDPYLVWAKRFDLVESAAELNADKDQDTITNLLEYAFNLDGSRSDLSPVEPKEGVSGLPLCEAVAVDGLPGWRFTFMKRLDDPRLKYTVQASSDGEHWEDQTAEPKVTSVDSQWERIVMEDVIPEDWDTGFFRVAVDFSKE